MTTRKKFSFRAAGAAAAVGVALAVAACGGSSSSHSASASPSQSSSGSSAASSSASIATTKGPMGTYLTGASGRALYLWVADKSDKSTCAGSCAQAWPPLKSPAPAGTGVSGRLSVLNDVNGQQVTYNGHPLYTFVDDHAGQVTGQGVQNFFVATPGIARLSGSSAPTGTVPASPSGPAAGGYGY